jgi:hypothetical protein
MPLTDVAIRNAKEKEKSYKISDMLGLFLLISPSGSKLWKMKYRFRAFSTAPESRMIPFAQKF